MSALMGALGGLGLGGGGGATGEKGTVVEKMSHCGVLLSCVQTLGYR
jgi:hypothetical protein